MSLANKHILLGVTGSIAAYKSAEIIRQLHNAGAQVRVVMTHAATKFITPLTLHALSGYPVYQQDLLPENAMVHIELARWADFILIAPASADFIANLALGKANSLLTAMTLAAVVPLAIAPAMNQAMWNNQTTQAHIKNLSKKVHILKPDHGLQACGETGVGRMQQPQTICNSIVSLLSSGLLSGKNVLITAGPTHEYLDPVRYLANASSGKMGFALATAAIDAGATTSLIAGPVNLATPKGCDRINVISAQQMYDEVTAKLSDVDIFIAVAAVADYKPATYHHQKMTKEEQLQINLLKNPDIVSKVAENKNIFTVGFAAQTHDLEKYAHTKLISKKLDMIIANDVSNAEISFGSDDNQVLVISQKNQHFLEKQRKHKLATKIVQLIAEEYNAQSV